MNSLPIRIFHAAISGLILGTIVFVAGLQFMQHTVAQETGGGSPEATTPPPVPPPPVLNPTPDDLDGDGIPNVWETANSHHPNNPKDAASDFDFDGLTAKQEYDLSVSSGGQYGKPLGTYRRDNIPPPPGYTTASYGGRTGICTAKNGILATVVYGRYNGSTTSSYRCYTYNPATTQWTYVAPPAAFPTAILYPTDVNSRGQVVGYTNSRIGFVWTPNPAIPAGGSSVQFFIYPSSGTPQSAIPCRISDTGYLLYSTSISLQPRLAADPKQRPITPVSGAWTTPDYVDVNDYGEYVGMIMDPFTGVNNTFLAIPGGPVYLSALSLSDFKDDSWIDAPDVDISEIDWHELVWPDDYYDEFGNYIDPYDTYTYGTAIDRATQEEVEFRQNWEGIWWRSMTGSDAFYNCWKSLLINYSPAALNDWGEFAGAFTTDLKSSYGYVYAYYDEFGNVVEDVSGEYLSNESTTGVFLFDGSYKTYRSGSYVFGVSNDPQVLLGDLYYPSHLWSDSVVAPLTKIFPSGTSLRSVNLCDNGLCVGWNGSNLLQLLSPNDDADGDGMPDDWEVYYGFNPSVNDSNLDADGDGNSNHAEFLLRSDPNHPPVTNANGEPIDTRPGIDTDGDGMPNSWEVANGLAYDDSVDAPLDYDRDGYTNLQEFRLNTDPRGAPAYRINEPGPFPNTRSVSIWSAKLGYGDPFDSCLQPADGTSTDTLYFQAVPGNGTWSDLPASWTKAYGSETGSLAIYPALTSASYSYELASSPSGACIRQTYGNPIMLHYWASPVNAPISLSGGAGQNDVNYLYNTALSPSGTYFAATRNPSSNPGNYDLILWKMPASPAQTWKPVKLTPPTGISTNPWQQLSINDYGYAVGSGTNSSGQSVPVLWKLNDAATAATPVVLPALAGGTWARAVGLTNHPSPLVAGTSNISGGQSRATVWTSSGAARNLGILPNGTMSEILTISPAGYLAGRANTLVNGVLGYMPFIAAPVGSSDQAAPLPFAYRLVQQGNSLNSNFTLTSIADSGEMFGQVYQYTPEYRQIPTLWRRGTACPLDAILPQSSGYTLSSVSGINSNGSLLVHAWKSGVQSTLLLTADRDTDGDGMPDAYENLHGFNPFVKSAPTSDSDSDGLCDIDEYRYGTDPQLPDSDSDGILDGWEVSWGLLPLDSSDAALDPDCDHVTNLREFQIGTTPTGIYKVETRLTDTQGIGPYVIAAGDDGQIIHTGQSDYVSYTLPDGMQYSGSSQQVLVQPASSEAFESIFLPSSGYTQTYNNDWSRYTYGGDSISYYADSASGTVNVLIQRYSYSYDGSNYSGFDTAYLIQDAAHLTDESWVPWDTIQVNLRGVTGNDGLPVLSSDETLYTYADAVSSSGNQRIHRTSNYRALMLDARGDFISELPMEFNWQAVNNLGQAAVSTYTYVSGVAGQAGYYMPGVGIHDNGITSILPLPCVPGMDTYPSVIAFSDDGKVLLSLQTLTSDRNWKMEYGCLDTVSGTFTSVRQPNLGSESVNFLSSHNGRTLGTGPKSFQTTPDGTCIRLDALRIKNSPAEVPMPLGTLYPQALTANHVSSDGTLTVSTANNSGQAVILQIVPHNDSDGDGIADDWEAAMIEDEIAAGNPVSNTVSTFDPSGDADLDGLKNLHEYELGTNPFYQDHPGLKLELELSTYSETP